jgi:predicted lysophospholipase L1 biosynthesis ABC-type transport system permease subunit
MNNQNEHLDNLKEIRSIMERSSRFLSLSGLSGVFAGVVAILGALAVYLYKADFFFGRYYNGGILHTNDMLAGSELSKFVVFILADASLVLLLALAFGVYFTTRNARRKKIIAHCLRNPPKDAN